MISKRNEKKNTLNVLMHSRQNKANEIKSYIQSTSLDKNSSGLKKFNDILHKWVRFGIKTYGIINLPDIKKDLLYQLDKPEDTVVKLSDEKKKGIPKIKNVKIGRNDPCNCNSGKKYKKCCDSKTHIQNEINETIDEEIIEEIVAESNL